MRCIGGPSGLCRIVRWRWVGRYASCCSLLWRLLLCLGSHSVVSGHSGGWWRRSELSRRQPPNLTASSCRAMLVWSESKPKGSGSCRAVPQRKGQQKSNTSRPDRSPTHLLWLRTMIWLLAAYPVLTHSALSSIVSEVESEL